MISSLLSLAGLLRDWVFAVVVIVALSILVREGAGGLARKSLLVLRQLRAVDVLICWLLRREVRSFLRQLDPKTFSTDSKKKQAKIPEQGVKFACGDVHFF